MGGDSKYLIKSGTTMMFYHIIRWNFAAATIDYWIFFTPVQFYYTISAFNCPWLADLDNVKPNGDINVSGIRWIQSVTGLINTLFALYSHSEYLVSCYSFIIWEKSFSAWTQHLCVPYWFQDKHDVLEELGKADSIEMTLLWHIMTILPIVSLLSGWRLRQRHRS